MIDAGGGSNKQYTITSPTTMVSYFFYSCIFFDIFKELVELSDPKLIKKFLENHLTEGYYAQDPQISAAPIIFNLQLFSIIYAHAGTNACYNKPVTSDQWLTPHCLPFKCCHPSKNPSSMFIPFLVFFSEIILDYKKVFIINSYAPFFPSRRNYLCNKNRRYMEFCNL